MSSRDETNRPAQTALTASLTFGFQDADDLAPREGPDASYRYRDVGLLGMGGMGEVRRVHDLHLDRTVAMKVLRADLAGHPKAEARFVEEARLTARLQHPGILSIHEQGRLPDGRPYFTMREVSGHTLAAILDQGRWPLRRLLTGLQAVSEAVAYAHSTGVVHRDLKPSNISFGPFGDALVLDWGIAQSTEETPTGVSGTPAYMPPEQAAGRPAGPEADVYALGAVLYEVVTGRPPYRGEDVLDQLLAGPPPAPSAVSPGVDPDLEALVLAAMERDPRRRPQTLEVLTDGLRDWLDGVQKRDQALAMVSEAAPLPERAQALRTEADRLEDRARATLVELAPTAPVDQKRTAWADQDRAAALREEADVVDAETLRTLHGALGHAPDLPEAHAALADHWRRLHARAEAAGDSSTATRAGIHLAAHDRGQHAAYLRGDGAISLRTEPRADVELFRYELNDRRLEPRFVRDLGRTPLVQESLPMGSWLLRLTAEGHHPVDYPVFVRRTEHWDGIDPDGVQQPIPLPPLGTLGPDECYVPAGWFQAGGDPEASRGLPARRVWTDGFAIGRFNITNEEYLAYLDALVDAGREAEALTYAPRERDHADRSRGAVIFGQDADGHFFLREDADGDRWDERFPVCMVDFRSAMAYARWRADRDGVPWRLPFELERAKATRGVDGRFFPWGDHHDFTFSALGDSVVGRSSPQRVEDWPTDVSPYGVRGLAGNMRDWLLDAYDPLGPPLRDGRLVRTYDPDPDVDRVNRGGTWSGGPIYARAASRGPLRAHMRYNIVGIRLARSWP